MLVTRKQLECVMHVRMSKASELFGLSITALRSACRRLGIKKWSAKNLRGGLAEHAAAIADVGAEEQEALDAHDDFEETAEFAHAAKHAPGTQFVPHLPGVPLPQHPPAYPRPLDPSFHAHGWHSAPPSEARCEPPHGFPPVARHHAWPPLEPLAPAPPEWFVEMAQSAPHVAHPPHVGHAAPAAPADNPPAAPPPPLVLPPVLSGHVSSFPRTKRTRPAANAQGHNPLAAPPWASAPAVPPPPLPPFVQIGHAASVTPYQSDTPRPSPRTNRTRGVSPSGAGAPSSGLGRAPRPAWVGAITDFCEQIE